MVLVCRRDVVRALGGWAEELPWRVAEARRRMQAQAEAMAAVADLMQLAGGGGPTAALYQKAASLYPWADNAQDFIPDEEWLIAELQHLVELMLMPSDSGDVRGIAARLVGTPRGSAIPLC